TGMSWRTVEEVVVLLDVLAVVALGAGQPEEAFLEDGVGLVPQGQGKAQQALVIADAQQAVLAPAVGARAGVVMGEGIPRRPTRGVIFAHRAPLALAEVRSP